MALTRRTLTLGSLALGLAACSGGTGGGPVARSGLDPAFRPQPNPAFDAWLAAYRGRAAARGISQATLDSALSSAGFLPGVIERDRRQTEFTRTLEDYLAIAASDERVRTGRAKLRATAGTLSAIEARYGVPANVVTAIWGLESQYGERRGDISVISAAATLAFDGRRGPFFEQQLDAALRILQRGDTSPANMTGSWAGAMGHTQFIPTTFESFAVDFTGDGRRDIWSNDPTDALASAANYLSRSGWRRGAPWGLEVVVPADYSGPSGRGATRSAASWRAAGLTAADGGRIGDFGSAALLRPQGAGGPAFLAFPNFNVILRYNNSENYGIGIGHLSDRIAGGGPIRASFPPDAQGLTIDDRKELQERLTRAGFDTQGTDGVIGSNTEAAIRAYQAANGLPVDGVATRGLLDRLR